MTEDATTLTVLRAIKTAQFACLDDLYAANLSVFLTGPEGHTEAWRDFDPEPAQRAAAAFGLTGGELRGCHAAGCDVCASNGGCGDEGCGRCEEGLQRYRKVVEAFHDGDTTTPIGGIPELGQVDTARRVASYVDAHCHLKGPSAAEWFAYKDAGTTPSIFDSWVNRTESGLAGQGVATAVLSVQTQAEKSATVVNDKRLDEACAYAASLYPTFFVPLARGFRTSWRRDFPYIAAALGAGFDGVGELLIHDASDSVTKMYEDDAIRTMVEMFTVVANAQKIAMVHWNMGSVAYGFTTVSPAESHNQLLAVLGAFPQTKPSDLTALVDPMPLKLILAHCGAGPAAGSDPHNAERIAFEAFLGTYQGWIEDLLANFPNVYFDLAGMQVSPVESLFESSTGFPVPTAFGYLVLDWIAQYPERFLVGTDAIGSDYGSIDMGTGSYANYVTFLALTRSSGSTLSAADIDKVLSTNLSTILADVF